MELVEIVQNWNNQDKDIFAKFKGDFHTYPTKKNNRIADKMSILEYLDKVKESRFFDFDSEYLSDKSLYNEFMLLREELNRKRTEVTTEEIERFLYDVSQDKELGQKMVKEFAGNPRETENIKNKIINLLGNNANAQDKFYKWYHDEVQGYKSAYKNYYRNLYNDATSLMTLVKESPNIAPWAFVSKANELNVEPTLGKLPKKFGNLDEYRTLISELIKFDKDYQNKYTKNRYKKIKAAEHYITINDKLFKIEKLHGGMSAKTKYKVTPDGDDMYIIKFNEYDAIGNTWRSKQIRENQAMRADSPYLDAMVDFYLKENNSPNVATVEFFDNKSKSVIYKLTKGEILNSTDKNIYNLYLFNNLKLVEDLKKLGITLNDVNVGNFIVDQQGNNILIDTGHVDYSLMFRPMVPGKHISLSNICGRSL